MGKQAKVVPGLPVGGRKSAYVLRNRTALVRSAQEVFAKLGPTATVDDIAEHAQISVSTIYKHFENKESIFKIAISTAFADWEQWALPIARNNPAPLAQLVMPLRLLLRMNQTHPHYAELCRKNFGEVQNQTAIQQGLVAQAQKLLETGVLKGDNFDVRLENLAACILIAFRKQLFETKPKELEADLAIEIALTMLNISPAKAKELAHGKLPDLTTDKK
jgi:AcrR family transcriptional regulator